jgi:hypothetical protein
MATVAIPFSTERLSTIIWRAGPSLRPVASARAAACWRA